jgi:hypothetical protein
MSEEALSNDLPLLGPVVFVDADVLLHGKPLNQLPWDRLCPGIKPTIALFLTVVGQVDGKKNDPRLRERAVRALRDIRGFRANKQVCKGIPFRIVHDAVREEDISAPLMFHCVDDRILTAVLQMRSAHPACEPRLMSGDYVMEVKCESLGIPFVALDEDSRLPPPADELTKQLRDLEGQVATLQARIPDLHIEAEYLGRLGRSQSVVSCEATEEDRTAEIDKAVNQEVCEAIGGYERLEHMEQSRRAEWERYIKDLRSHLSLLQQKDDICQRAFVCRVSLANNGSAPATHVDVRITFPGKVHVIAKDSDLGTFLTRLREPPKRPVVRSPFVLGDLLERPDFSRAFENLNITRRDERVPECAVKQRKAPDGQDVIQIQLGRIQQTECAECTDVLVVYESHEAITPLELVCVITASEVPTAVTQRLGLLVTGTERQYGEND